MPRSSPFVTFRFALAVALGVCALSCGKFGEKDAKGSSKDRSAADGAAIGATFDVPVELGGSGEGGSEGGVSLALTTASGWAEVSISGCASGYSKAASRYTLPASLPVLRGDRGCVASLLAFENAGRECRKADGSAMDGVGPEAFRCGSGAYWVTRVSGFGASATSGTQLGWVFGRIEKGAPRKFITIGPPTRVASGSQPGPLLALLATRGVSLTDLQYSNARNDSPTFTFTLACGNALTSGPGACPDAAGQPQPFEDMDAVLVADTYNGNPSDGQLGALFKNGPGMIDGATFTTLASGSDAGPNGGVRFAAPMLEDLDTNKDMLLVIRYLTTAKAGGGRGGKGGGGNGGGGGTSFASYVYQPVRFVLAN